jgi:ATP-dependent DNA ligase
MVAHRNYPQGFVEPCLSTRAAKPPAGADGVHEIKHDGYRLIVRRDGNAVRLFTRRGYDWITRYPAITMDHHARGRPHHLDFHSNNHLGDY